jgi:threonine dehydratase
VHPYDDAAIVAGQGTMALEMLAQVPQLDTLLVSIGGGGMLAGMSVAAHALRPDMQVYGAQAERFPTVWNALHGGQLECGQATVADGIAVKSPGGLTLPLLHQHLRDVLLVDEDPIEQAILMLLEIEKTVVEGAGAVGLAALLQHRERFAGRHVGLVLSGGNIEPLMLAEIIHRGMVKSARLVRLRFDVRDVPGTLAEVAAALGRQGANIDQVQHQRAFTGLSLERVQIEVVVHTRGAAHVEQMLQALHGEGYRVERVA